MSVESPPNLTLGYTQSVTDDLNVTGELNSRAGTVHTRVNIDPNFAWPTYAYESKVAHDVGVQSDGTVIAVGTWHRIYFDSFGNGKFADPNATLFAENLGLMKS